MRVKERIVSILLPGDGMFPGFRVERGYDKLWEHGPDRIEVVALAFYWKGVKVQVICGNTNFEGTVTLDGRTAVLKLGSAVQSLISFFNVPAMCADIPVSQKPVGASMAVSVNVKFPDGTVAAASFNTKAREGVGTIKAELDHTHGNAYAIKRRELRRQHENSNSRGGIVYLDLRATDLPTTLGHPGVQSVTASEQSVDGDMSGVGLSAVCPKSKPGEFRHGTKCTGYYDAAALVDIQIAGNPTSKEYVSTKSLVHAGVDLVAPEGNEIYPIADGTVDAVISSDKDANFKSLGYMVLIQHKNKFEGKPTWSLYLHLKEKPSVVMGDAVTAGKTLLGRVGSTGAAFGPHLHLEVRHFAGRFSEKWKNIYGIERPSSEATFGEKDFAENWTDPEKFAAAAANAPPANVTGTTSVAAVSDAKPVSLSQRKRMAEENLNQAYKLLRAKLDTAGKNRLAQELLDFIRSRKRFSELSTEWVQMTEEKAEDLQRRLDSSN